MIFLVQHGKNLDKTQDPDKGLSREGKEQTRQTALLARASGARVSHILHSGKKRAEQTASILAHVFGAEAQQAPGLGPLDDVTRAADRLFEKEGLMLVGHLPFMEKLASYLVLGKTRPGLVRFQNSGIVCMDRDPKSSAWCVVWALLPEFGPAPEARP